ncbi:hypothetical protein LWI29_037675 [Acer saccharum]|uniref:Apple domain-containing protein n=1 Tax=Acer saccharum TaxID=4024 RepID=A0AA39SZZ1_ACESA|nr:hypothetical protein LWI29_037675 [Acer saccharum]
MSYGVCPIFENKMTPICRKGVLDFNLKYGFMPGDGFKFKESDKMTSIDFELKCQNNCSCYAYATTNRENDIGYLTADQSSQLLPDPIYFQDLTPDRSSQCNPPADPNVHSSLSQRNPPVDPNAMHPSG